MSTGSTGFLELNFENETRDDVVDLFHLDAIQEPNGAIRHVNDGNVEIWRRESRPIGTGGFGLAWLETEAGGRTRVVKEVRKVIPNVKTRYWVRELSSMALLSKNKTLYPEFYGWFQDESHVYIAMEHFSLGDLQHSVNDCLPQDQAALVVSQISTALEVMHRRRITHRDLKPANILVRHPPPAWQVVVSDFGVSKRVRGVTTVLHTSFEGDFMAPEILGFVDDGTSGDYTSAVDLWSLGCLAYWLLKMAMPVPRHRMMAHCNRSWSDATKNIDMADIDENGTDFVLSLLKPDPQQRMTATQARSHTWLQSALNSSTSIRPTFHRPAEIFRRLQEQQLRKGIEASETSQEQQKFIRPAEIFQRPQEQQLRKGIEASETSQGQQKFIRPAEIFKEPQEQYLRKGIEASETSQEQQQFIDSVPRDLPSAVRPERTSDGPAVTQILRQRTSSPQSAEDKSSLLDKRGGSDNDRSSDNAQASPEGLKLTGDTDEAQTLLVSWTRPPTRPASANTRPLDAPNIIDFAAESQVRRDNAKLAAQQLVDKIISARKRPLTEQQNDRAEKPAWSSIKDEQESQLRKDVQKSPNPGEPHREIIAEGGRQRTGQRAAYEDWLPEVTYPIQYDDAKAERQPHDPRLPTLPAATALKLQTSNVPLPASNVARKPLASQTDLKSYQEPMDSRASERVPISDRAHVRSESGDSSDSDSNGYRGWGTTLPSRPAVGTHATKNFDPDGWASRYVSPEFNYSGADNSSPDTLRPSDSVSLRSKKSADTLDAYDDGHYSALDAYLQTEVPYSQGPGGTDTVVKDGSDRHRSTLMSMGALVHRPRGMFGRETNNEEMNLPLTESGVKTSTQVRGQGDSFTSPPVTYLTGRLKFSEPTKTRWLGRSERIVTLQDSGLKFYKGKAAFAGSEVLSIALTDNLYVRTEDLVKNIFSVTWKPVGMTPRAITLQCESQTEMIEWVETIRWLTIGTEPPVKRKGSNEAIYHGK